eukprot:7144457-Prymnesium_polylepis.1
MGGHTPVAARHAIRTLAALEGRVVELRPEGFERREHQIRPCEHRRLRRCQLVGPPCALAQRLAQARVNDHAHATRLHVPLRFVPPLPQDGRGADEQGRASLPRRSDRSAARAVEAQV